MLKKLNLNFIIRTILFIVLYAPIFDFVVLSVLFTMGLLPVITASWMCNYLNGFFLDEEEFSLFNRCDIYAFAFIYDILPWIVSPFVCWLYAKIFGYFKELDKLDLSKKQKYMLLTLILLLIILVLSSPIIDRDASFINKNWGYLISILPLSYFLYTKANEFTPKYKLLQKIGYICSSRFVKDTFKKAREKFCHGKKE